MKLQNLSARAVAAGAASAVALGSALAMAPVAQAAPATNNYTCTNPLAGPYDITVVTDVLLPPTTNAGTSVPADLLDVTNKVTIPQAAMTTFMGLGVTKVDMTDYKLSLGDVAVGAGSLTVVPSSFVAQPTNTYVADINGKNAAFVTPEAGTYMVTAPSSFKLRATLGNGSTAELVCATTANSAPTSVGSVTVNKNVATVTGKAKAVKAGKDAKIKVTVASENVDATGQVVAKVGKKQIKATVTKGKAVVKIKAKFLKPGKNNVKLKYAGDAFVDAAKAKVSVKVAK